MAAGDAVWTTARLDRLHVIERRRIATDDDPLADLDRAGLRALHRRARLAVGPRWLLVATVDRSATGAPIYRARRRAGFEARAAAVGLALAEAGAPACLARDGRWCCVPAIGAERWSRPAFVAGVAGLVLALVLMVRGRWRAARAAADERALIIRTLTHELRTPATALSLCVEPLRAAYDELLDTCQLPVLRLADSVARLNRALAVSARFLTAARDDARLAPERIELVAFVGELAATYGDAVRLVESDPIEVRTAADAVAICVRNLVENALAHGAPPVEIRVHRARFLGDSSARPHEVAPRVPHQRAVHGHAARVIRWAPAMGRQIPWACRRTTDRIERLSLRCR